MREESQGDENPHYLTVITASGFAASRVLPAVQQALFSNPISAELTGFLLLTLPVTLYFALTESSAGWQGTWGKHIRHVR